MNRFSGLSRTLSLTSPAEGFRPLCPAPGLPIEKVATGGQSGVSGNSGRLEKCLTAGGSGPFAKFISLDTAIFDRVR